MSIQEFIWEVNIPLIEDVSWNTLVTKYESGKEQRRQKWSQPKRGYSIALSAKSDVIMQQVWDFYNSRNGAYDTFYFENPMESPVANEAFGTGNGVTTSFQLAHYPLPSGSISISDSGSNLTETTNYTLTRSTGALEFSVAPSGSLLASYSFCRIVRFAEDKLSRELFSYKLLNADLKLIEVL